MSQAEYRSKINARAAKESLGNGKLIRKMSALRHCSLFTGIGGFDVGLSRAGIETVMVCDNDTAAREVLKKRFGDVAYRKDVDRLKSLPRCEVLTAGWPCQDLSQVGRAAGIDGSRSGLINRVFELLQATKHKPQFVVLENVAFALHLHAGRAIQMVVSQLESLGYRWSYRILDTQEFGLPQRRRRIFIVAARDFDPVPILFDGSCPAIEEKRARYNGFYWTEGNRGIGWTSDGIPPLKGGSALSIPSPPAIWDRETHEFFSPGIRDAERLQGFPSGWTSPATERSGRVRWRLIGNAVSVPIAKWLGRRIVAAESETLRSVEPVGLREPKRHNMAWGACGQPAAFAYLVREGARESKRVSIAKFRFSDQKPLSTRAASGFLTRLIESPLCVESDFVEDLAMYSGLEDLVRRKVA